MGEKLAKELQKFLVDLPKNVSIKKISFVGHSLGGLICRSSF